MAIGNTPYSSERWNVSHTLPLGKLAASGSNPAAEVIGRHRFFTAVKVLEARAIVTTAGKAATSVLTICKGTASIGAITIGTNTAGTVVDATLTDTDFATTEDLNVQMALATDTGAAFVSFQYQETYA